MSNMHHKPKEGPIIPESKPTLPAITWPYPETLRTLVPEIVISVDDEVPIPMIDAALIGLKEAFDAAIDPRSTLSLPEALDFDEVKSLFEAQNVSLRKTTGLSQRVEQMLTESRGRFELADCKCTLDVVYFHDSELKEEDRAHFCSPTGLNFFLFSRDIGMLDHDTGEPDYYHGLTSCDDRFVAVSVFRPLHARTELTQEDACKVVQYLTRHEVGHILGLVRRNDPTTTEFLYGAHCVTDGCTMRQSGDTQALIEQALKQAHTLARLRTGHPTDHFCAHCLGELIERYNLSTVP